MHIFLTGERGVGKSTLLNKIISDIIGRKAVDVGGFCTVAGEKQADGYEYIYIVPYSRASQQDVALHQDKTPPVGARKKGGFPEAFNKYGVEKLRATLESDPMIIIMDELGFMESDAFEFQKMVMNILDGEIPVFGVIKPRQTSFLDHIRERDDVRIIEVTTDNRDDMADEIRGALMKQLHEEAK